MLFFPFRADIRLPGIPFITIFISLLCLFIFWQQTKSHDDLLQYTSEFCSEQPSRKDTLILKKLAAANNLAVQDTCEHMHIVIHRSEDKEAQIRELVENTTKFSTKSTKRTHAYISQYVTEKSTEFTTHAPEDMSMKLSYYPDSYNVFSMITSAFAHGSWSHVIGNLFFFFAFAATIEAILGVLFFPAIVLVLAIGTNLAYSLTVIASPESMPTLGLSGVVMGVMGLFTYFLPYAKIRCFFWFVIFIRRFGIYAWMLALWYFGWDVYDLYQTGNSGGVNLVAHVSGFIQGYLMGVLFFRWHKMKVHETIKNNADKNAFGAVLAQ